MGLIFINETLLGAASVGMGKNAIASGVFDPADRRRCDPAPKIRLGRIALCHCHCSRLDQQLMSQQVTLIKNGFRLTLST